MADIIGGTWHGMARDVKLHSVRVLNCNGQGTEASIIAGLDWVAENAIRPAVANLSASAAGYAYIDTNRGDGARWKSRGGCLLGRPFQLS